MPTWNRDCQECGAAYKAKRAAGRFCSPACRKAFGNRRMERGAIVYDLFMAMRYERDRAKEAGLWGALCRIAEDHRDEDIAKRAGRASWQDMDAIFDERPYLFATRLPRMKMGRMK